MKTTRPLSLSVVLVLFAITAPARADGPGDNLPDKVRRVPPPGIAVPATVRAELTDGAAKLGREIEMLRGELKAKPALLALLPDAQIYHNAVRYALTYDEFFKTNELDTARTLLRQGMERVQSLRAGQSPWTATNGLVVRGYLSRVDGSVQPYGLVIPASWQPGEKTPFRLDFWFHGRGETLSELDFINGRQKSPGEFAPSNTFVLHLYGRYCNGSRFAGETDLFEALDNVRLYYPIDENRLVVRGFSLGGAACWHFATHYSSLWAAAAPGAGFSETADFLKVFQNEKLQPSWFEQKLWHLYDATDYAVNLMNCPTIAYSGELDTQKQAADMMVKALAAEGIKIPHLIGPQTKHSYHPESKKELNARIDELAAKGRTLVPPMVRFTTWTLRYNQMAWLTADALGHHWERARIDARFVGSSKIEARTENVTAFTIKLPSALTPLNSQMPLHVVIDGSDLVVTQRYDYSWLASFQKLDGRWVMANRTNSSGLSKRHGLQGPIDDAFYDSFLMVRPTGQPLNKKVGAWAAAELAHATNQWRQQFRGEARVKDDADVNDTDIAAHNLVLWGDPSSNKLLARIADKLPVRWDAKGITLGKQSFDPATHVPVLIYPNPLNPQKYVVINSGFTFREYDYLNNARQTPKLPDFAVIDVSKPVTSRAPGGIAAAGFFGEQWELPEPLPKP